MPPKKKRGKKANPPDPQQDTVADKRRKKKKWIKESEALLKKFKRQLKDIEDRISSGNNETDNPVTPGCNQGEKEDINLPHSSCSRSSTPRASKQNANQQSDSVKVTKNINLPNLSSSGSSTPRASGQKGNQKSDSTKNINRPNSSSKKTSSLYNTGHQVDQKNDNSKKTKKTKNDRIPQKEKSQIKLKLPVLKHTKTITETTKLSSNIDEARQSCSQSVPIKYSGNKCQKGGQAITQVKAENKATANIKTLEPDKSIELVSNTLKSDPQKEHIQRTENLTKEKKKLQEKLGTCEAEKNLLNEQEQKLLSPVKGTKTGIMGRIEILPTDKSVKKSDKESSLSYEYEKGPGKIFIKDQNIKISIEVTEGIQVVCNSKTRPVTDLVEDVKSRSGTLEGYSTERAEEQKLLSPVKGTKKGIMGKIEILPTDKSVKKSDKESSLSYEYEKGPGKIFIKDQNIKISIEVTEGIQVVCNSKTRPVNDLVEDVKTSSGTLEVYSTERPEDIKTDLVEDVKSSSVTLEGHTTERPEDIKTDLVDVKSSSGTLEGHATTRPEEIKTDSENYCKPTSDTKCDPHAIMKFLNENRQTVDNQATGVRATNTLIDSEQHSKTGNAPKSLFK